ncbi:hypothetical protein B0E49_13290 [Polaromonas sp. C04]|nr:hypothetical protein B0E49_13290 [Polaromonas sp. C04]
MWRINYDFSISIALDEIPLLQLPSGIGVKQCDTHVKELLASRPPAPPTEIVARLQSEANELTKGPLEFYGIEIPEKITIGVLGTNVKIGLEQLTALLLMILGPLLVLWLGSIYQTRYRETRLTYSAKNIWQVFPHSVNMYPVGVFPELRKTNWAAYHSPKLVAATFFLLRCGFVFICVAPPISAYLLSLYYTGSYDSPYFLLYGFAGFAVFGLASLTLLVEAMPWHVMKTFKETSRS